MNDIDTIPIPAATMTSREIADLVELRHDNVKRTIETLAGKGVIGLPQIEEYRDSLGRPASQFKIGKRDSFVIVAQLSPEFTARLVDRWQELEEQARNPMGAMTRLELLQLAMDSERANIALTHKVTEMAPKVQALDLMTTVSAGSYCLRDAAKVLRVPEKKFLQEMQNHELIYRQAGGPWRAYSVAQKAGLLEHKITTGQKDDGSTWESVQVRVTSRGMATAALLFGIAWVPTTGAMVATPTNGNAMTQQQGAAA